MKKCSEYGIKSFAIKLNKERAINLRNNGFDIILVEAMSALKEIPDNNFSLITMFNIIEYINLDSLNLLLLECKRLLKDNGLLVLQTPSRYNLSISNSLLNTNPDLFAFELGKVGFNGIQTFYIDKALLEYEDKYCLTRILNGLAQHLVIIATKSENSSLQLTKNSAWKASLKPAFNAIKAAKEYDNQLRIKSINKEESIKHLTERILLLERTIQSILNSRFYRITVIVSRLFNIIYSQIKAIKIFIIMILLKL